MTKEILIYAEVTRDNYIHTVFFELANKANKDEENAYTLLYKLGTVLGFTFEKAELTEEEISAAVKQISTALSQEFDSMESILELRKQARAEKSFPRGIAGIMQTPRNNRKINQNLRDIQDNGQHQRNSWQKSG